MPPLPHRCRSPIEIAGGCVALTAAVAALTALLGNPIAALLALPIDRGVWRGAASSGRLAFVGMLPIVAIAFSAVRWLPERRAARWPLLAASVAAAVATGWALQAGLLALDGEPAVPPAIEHALQHTLAVTAALVTALAEYRHQYGRAAEAWRRAEIAGLRLQVELAASRLKLLEAQIEPHFLFNSLANVRRLLHTDGASGSAMLADLSHYLAHALPRLRDDAPTLAHEVEVTRAFLAVHQVRMGARLRVAFDVPAALGALVVPPTMLVTLAENAVKHGLQPLREGGAITVAAERSGTTLRVHVADTGRGFAAALGTGTGLANLRARLRSMHGDAASLSLRVNEPRGVVATLELPVPAA